MSGIFEFLKELLGFAAQERDPEVIRKAKLRDIDAQLKALEARRDQLMSTNVTPENENSLGADLGIVFSRISRLRQDRKTYER